MGFGLGDIPGVVMALILAAAMFVAGFLVLDGLDDDLTANSFAANATDDIEEGMANVTEYVPTVGTILGVSLILGVVIVGFAYGRGRGYF